MLREFYLFVLFLFPLSLTSQSSIIIVKESNGGCQPCYRKLFTGKRVAEIHIKRIIDCEDIRECRRECDSEKGFSCEGFNYRHPGPRGRNGICELTAMPPSQIDIGRDILREPMYDYYERDFGCPNARPSRPAYPAQSSGWLNVRPTNDHRRPINVPRPPIDIPRPLGPPSRPHRPDGYFPRRPHGSENRFQGEPPPWRPREPLPPINIRPIEEEVRFEHFRPGRPYLPKEPGRGPPNFGYRPHPMDLGTNEIEPYQPGRRKDTGHSLGGRYWGVYGGSYGYKTNHIDNYDPPKRGQSFNPPEKRPFDIGNTVNYGDVYNYGGAYGYGHDYIPPNRDVIHDGLEYSEHCSVRLGGGFKLRRGIVRKSYLTPSLDHCENLCAIEKDCICRTFSYRYSVAASAPTDNCLLSDISHRDLDFYTDLEPDRDYDIYSMNGDLKSCGEKRRPVSQRPPEECFWRVRSGCGVPPEVVRKALFVHGLGECEAECVEAQLFTCRSFVYRYDAKPTRDGRPNCFLSDWPSQEFDPLSLPDLDGAELYQRGSFGRGCEPSPFPPLNYPRRRPEPDERPPKKDEICYAEYQRPCRLTPDAVMLTIYVSSEFECRERCSEMRERGRTPCMSFSYRVPDGRDEHNCFMSDVPRRDLRPGIDYVHVDDHFLFAWKEFEPQCDSGYLIGIFNDEDPYNRKPNKNPVQRPGYHNTLGDPYVRPLPGSLAPHPPHLEPPFLHSPNGGGGYDYDVPRPARPHGGFNDHRVAERPFGNGDYGVNHGGHDTAGYYPAPPLNPDRPDPVRPFYRPGGNKRPIESGGFYGGDRGQSSFPDTDGRYGNHDTNDRPYYSHIHGGSTFQFFTVNGHPCKRGTRCERNKVAGFWSCEPEGSEFGTWDYCCEPTHHCGYSQGYHYQWCYVGPSEDQWRPCSEQYYPYLPNPRPTRPLGDRYDEEDPYGEVPRPGLLGRHWPVAYLHREAPPNATDSFGIGDNRRNRVLNSSKTLTDSSSSRGRGSTLNEDKKVSSDSQTRGNRNVAIISSVDQVGNSRTGKIERVSRFGEFQRRSASLLLPIDELGNKNFTETIKNSENEKYAEILELKDFIDDDINDESNSTDLFWDGKESKKFVKLPTISPNGTEDKKFPDYFEIVNVD